MSRSFQGKETLYRPCFSRAAINIVVTPIEDLLKRTSREPFARSHGSRGTFLLRLAGITKSSGPSSGTFVQKKVPSKRVEKVLVGDHTLKREGA